jgi:FkbM family methyltransferase
MDTWMMSPQSSEPPWGTYAPTGLNAALIRLSRAMPPNDLGRLMAGFFRKLVLLAGRGPLDLPVFGAPARFHPYDNLTEKRVAFMPQFFDPEERAALLAIMHKDFSFIDIGANAGFYSLFVAGKVGKSAKIIAVEPQEEMARRLRFNTDAGDFTQIIHENTALADGAGEAVLNIVHKNRGASGFHPRGNRSGDETITVPTMALLALMDKHAIERADAIKIDIEGAEDQVLPAFFETCPPERLPKLMIIERNQDWAVDCIALAINAGYRDSGQGRKNAILRLIS